MFLEAEPQAEPHLAEGTHHRLLLVGSLVHVCPAPPRQHFCRERARGPSGIRCLFLTTWIRDTGWVKKSGSGMNKPDHISESLETIFWVKILEFFDSDPGWKKIWIWDPGWKKFGPTCATQLLPN
jgi:hypothetical protein